MQRSLATAGACAVMVVARCVDEGGKRSEALRDSVMIPTLRVHNRCKDSAMIITNPVSNTLNIQIVIQMFSISNQTRQYNNAMIRIPPSNTCTK